MAGEPFFLIGCVRSGTTFLRDVLRRHPNLAAPAETHFYRWADPFGTLSFKRRVQADTVLKRHRKIDGISEELFSTIMSASVSRADLYRRYMRNYRRINKPRAARWFDKTPQNVYGVTMILSEFPRSKLLHIVRNPLDVVASLKRGETMHVPQLVGACNYWREAVEIMQVISKSHPRRVYEVRYEDLTADLPAELSRLFEFLGEEYDPTDFSGVPVTPAMHDHEQLFTPEERAKIARLCTRLAKPYGYFEE
jgi:hypothetical protein